MWVASSIFVGLALWGGVFAPIELKTWGWRLRSIARHSLPNPHVKIITIDQSSLEYMSREMGLA